MSFCSFPFDILNENEISIETYCDYFQHNQPHMFLDIRETWEREKAVISPSEHIILSNLRKEIEKIIPTQWTIIYCHHGSRSLQACHLLKSLGFDKVMSLQGGIHRWATTIDHQMETY